MSMDQRRRAGAGIAQRGVPRADPAPGWRSGPPHEDFTAQASGPVPLYRQVALWIRQQIAQGVWPPESALPPEHELARRLGVSRGTLRAALAELDRQGVIVRLRGRGTFVAGCGTGWLLSYPLLSLAESLDDQGLPLTTDVLQQEVTTPPLHVRRALRLTPEDRVLYLRRVRRIGPKPVALLHNWVATARCPGIERVDYARTRLFDAIEERCGRLMWGRRTFAAVRAEGEVAGRLAMAEGEPALYFTQVTYLAQDVPVECSEGWLRGDAIRVELVARR